jgi:hypothetical protein
MNQSLKKDGPVSSTPTKQSSQTDSRDDSNLCYNLEDEELPPLQTGSDDDDDYSDSVLDESENDSEAPQHPRAKKKLPSSTRGTQQPSAPSTTQDHSTPYSGRRAVSTPMKKGVKTMLRWNNGTRVRDKT